MRFNWLLLLLPLSVSAQQKIPDNRISESSVTQHQSALTVTESQISDLSHTTDTNASTQCATGLVLGGAADGCISPGGAESNDLTAAVTWANVPDANITEGSVTQHQAALTVTESQVSDLSHTTDTDTQLTQEQVEDFAGALVTDGTGARTGIALTYQDATGDIDAVVDHDTAANFDAAEHFTQGAISITESQISDLSHTTDTFVTNKDSHDHVGGDGAALTITESQISDLSHTTDTDTQLTQEQVEDFAGGMDLGTETRLTFTYNDTSGNFDIVVDDMNQTSGDIDHDATTNFLVAEHVDWAGASAGTIHASNYVDNDTTYSVGDGGLTTNDFTAADHTKLDGIETGADVTDTANVTSSGALMDSEVDADIKTATIGASATLAGSNTGDQDLADTVAEITDLDNDAATLSLPASTTISTFGATVVDDADAATVRTTINAEQADANILKAPDNEVVTGDYDFSGGGIEIENGITPPACTEGQIYMDTDATSGQRLMACEGGTFVTQGDGVSKDVWVRLDDGVTAQSTGQKEMIFIQEAITITTAKLYCGTAPTGASLTVDVEDDGTTILSAVLEVEVSEKDSDDALPAVTVSSGSIAANSELSFDVDQIGTTIAGTDCSVFLQYYKT